MNERLRGDVMRKEIAEQPTAIGRLVTEERERVWQMAARWRDHRPRFIMIAARGTSDHAAMYAKYLFETIIGIPVGFASPSVAGVYGATLDVRDALVIGISQSGEAADVIAVIDQARQGGGDTLAVTNMQGSPLTVAAQETIELHAEPEIAVAATKTFTTSMAVMFMLAAAIKGDDALCAQVDRIPALIDDVLRHRERVDAVVERFRFLEECVVIGRGYNMATAFELSLKLRETCYVRAQPFASPDFVHGPIAILEEGYPVITFANTGPTLPSVLEVIGKAHARGAETIVVGNAAQALEMADVTVPVTPGDDLPEYLSPFPCIVAGQLFAQALSVLKGIDPDNPRGLRKVTVTQ